MTDSDTKEGIFEVLIERFEKERLPRILEIKHRIDGGRTLDDVDLDFLERVFRDSVENKHLIESIPQCKELFAQVTHLYHEITELALQNEKLSP